MTIIQKIYGKYEEKKVGVAVLYSTRFDNPKGTRIGPSYFYTSKLLSKYIKTIYFFKVDILYIGLATYAIS